MLSGFADTANLSHCFRSMVLVLQEGHDCKLKVSQGICAYQQGLSANFCSDLSKVFAFT